MPRHQTLTRENFEALLAWLDPDREQAGTKYENIRRTLIKIFTWNGHNNPGDGADETINRVAGKVTELSETYKGDPAIYFYAVARNVIREFRRREANREVPLPDKLQVCHETPEEEASDADRKRECLRECLEALTPDNRRLILKYYELEKRERIAARKELARAEGLDITYMRVKLHRIRTALNKCIERCLRRDEC